MAVYESVKFTKKGMSLMSRIYLGSTLKLTKLSISEEAHDGSELMKGIRQNIAICSFSYVDLDHLNIRAVGNNLELDDGYFAKSIGVYADDPIFGEILFCYSNAEPSDFIPPHKEDQGITDFEYNISFAIKDVEKIIVEVQNQTFASKSDFEESMKKRSVRYLMDHFPQLSNEDYFLDLVCTDRNDILSRIETLKKVEDIQLLDGSGTFTLSLGDVKDSMINNVKEHVSDMSESDDIAIII